MIDNEVALRMEFKGDLNKAIMAACGVTAIDEDLNGDVILYGPIRAIQKVCNYLENSGTGVGMTERAKNAIPLDSAGYMELLISKETKR